MAVPYLGFLMVACLVLAVHAVLALTGAKRHLYLWIPALLGVLVSVGLARAYAWLEECLSKPFLFSAPQGLAYELLYDSIRTCWLTRLPELLVCCAVLSIAGFLLAGRLRKRGMLVALSGMCALLLLLCCADRYYVLTPRLSLADGEPGEKLVDTAFTQFYNANLSYAQAEARERGYAVGYTLNFAGTQRIYAQPDRNSEVIASRRVEDYWAGHNFSDLYGALPTRLRGWRYVRSVDGYIRTQDLLASYERGQENWYDMPVIRTFLFAADEQAYRSRLNPFLSPDLMAFYMPYEFWLLGGLLGALLLAGLVLAVPALKRRLAMKSLTPYTVRRTGAVLLLAGLALAPLPLLNRIQTEPLHFVCMTRGILDSPLRVYRTDGDGMYSTIAELRDVDDRRRVAVDGSLVYYFPEPLYSFTLDTLRVLDTESGADRVFNDSDVLQTIELRGQTVAADGRVYFIGTARGEKALYCVTETAVALLADNVWGESGLAWDGEVLYCVVWEDNRYSLQKVRPDTGGVDTVCTLPAARFYDLTCAQGRLYLYDQEGIVWQISKEDGAMEPVMEHVCGLVGHGARLFYLTELQNGAGLDLSGDNMHNNAALYAYHIPDGETALLGRVYKEHLPLRCMLDFGEAGVLVGCCRQGLLNEPERFNSYTYVPYDGGVPVPLQYEKRP